MHGIRPQYLMDILDGHTKQSVWTDRPTGGGPRHLHTAPLDFPTVGYGQPLLTFHARNELALPYSAPRDRRNLRKVVLEQQPSWPPGWQKTESFGAARTSTLLITKSSPYL